MKREHVGIDDRCEACDGGVEFEQEVEPVRLDLREGGLQAIYPEAHEELRKHGEFAQDLEALEDARVVPEQAVALAETDLLEHVERDPAKARVAEGIEVAQRDALAVGKQRLVDRDRVEREALNGEAADRGAGGLLAVLVVLRTPRPAPERELEPRDGAARDLEAERLELGGCGKIGRRGELERPDDELAGQAVAARHALLALDIDGVDVGAGRETLALGEVRIVVGRLGADQRRGRNGRLVVRQELVEERRGELGEFALELQLDAGGHESRALEQARDAGIHLLPDEPAEPLGHTGILLREIGGALVEELELLVVELEELTIHEVAGSRDSWILPDDTSISATNSIGTSSG